jgi:hypothetical protein
MSLPLKVVRRLARDFVAPNLHRVKRRYPRMVMPGGLIERHLSRLHFGTNYHSVNVADLTRLWRRFPAEAFGPLLEGALGFVARTGLLEFWREADQKQALGYWVEALYQLCERRDEVALRHHLADAMLFALDAGLGLSPSLLGANPEVVRRDERTPCPSPTDARLRIANLGRAGRREWLVVNPATVPIPLAWERDVAPGMAWSNAGGPLSPRESLPLVPPGGFVLGRECRAP